MSQQADPSPRPPRLRVHGLSKRYGSVQALDRVDFELRAGEIMALLGENGAGKSTLVKVLAGLVEPDEGEIEVDGTPTRLDPSARSQAAGVAVVHQEYSSVPSMTVAENLVLGQSGVPRVWLPGALRKRARRLLDQVGLDDLDPGVRVEDLSVAEVQLVEIARLLVRDAQILVFDEPTAALTDHEIDRVLGVIRRLADQGRSVIYVTHRLAEVFRITDRVTIFRNGRSAPPEVTVDLDVDRVISLMLGRELETMFPSRDPLGDAPVMLEVDGLMAPGLTEPVSFVARRGEIVGLTGQLGSGAGVVVQAIAGHLPQTAGRVVIDGQDIAQQSPGAIVRHRVGYCSADRKRDGIFANRSIAENISAPWLRSVAGRGGWVAQKAERERTKEIAQRFTIDTDRLAAPVAALSGGNQQKVVVGKWLGIEPRVLLLEEPTRGVDVGARAEIYASLRGLCAAGLTIIVVSSDTAEVMGLCDTVASFYRGRLTSIKPYDERTEEGLTREVMHESVEETA